MSGSLVLIDEEIVSSAVASVTLTGIDSTYDVYMLRFDNVVPATDTQVLFWRLQNSGGDVTSTNYDYAMKVLRANTAFSNFTNANQSAFRDFTVGTGTQEQENGILYLFNFSDSSEYSFYTHETTVIDDQGGTAGMSGGGALTVAEAHTGLTFFFGSGNISSGNFKLYGLNK
jgi:hypothetical protein